MSKVFLALAGASTLSFAAAANAASLFEPSSFSSRPMVFEAADMDDNNMLSRAEYLMMRMNTVDDTLVYYYRGDTRQQAETAFARTFAEIDMDSNGMVSATEFANAPAVQPNRQMATGWAMSDGWDPEYMTVRYYLTANPVDADVVEGKDVVNLKGEDIGEIDQIIKTEAGRYYAMIDLEENPAYPPADRGREGVGVPLEDILLFDEGRSLMLTTRGEEYLAESDARRLEWHDVQPVDTLYRVA